jgi:hypothetical protein
MDEIETRDLKISVIEVKHILENIFLHHHGNVETLEKLGLNLGYPVLSVTWSAIEFVAGLCSKESPQADFVDEYFQNYMSKVDPRYGTDFSQIKLGIPGKQREGTIRCSKPDKRNCTNIGTVLREGMRNRLTHSCGSILEIDSREETRSFHLTIRKPEKRLTLFVHTYTLYHDYRASLLHVYERLDKDSHFFQTTFLPNLGREWARVMIMAESVDVLLRSYLEKQDSYPDTDKLIVEHELLSKLESLGQRFIKKDS